jgi:hypothetical protein
MDYIILTYNELDHSLPAGLRAGINYLQILLPLRDWKKERLGYLDRLSFGSESLKQSVALSCWLLVVKPIAIANRNFNLYE